MHLMLVTASGSDVTLCNRVTLGSGPETARIRRVFVPPCARSWWMEDLEDLLGDVDDIVSEDGLSFGDSAVSEGESSEEGEPPMSPEIPVVPIGLKMFVIIVSASLLNPHCYFADDIMATSLPETGSDKGTSPSQQALPSPSPSLESSAGPPTPTDAGRLAAALRGEGGASDSESSSVASPVPATRPTTQSHLSGAQPGGGAELYKAYAQDAHSHGRAAGVAHLEDEGCEPPVQGREGRSMSVAMLTVEVRRLRKGASLPCALIPSLDRKPVKPETVNSGETANSAHTIEPSLNHPRVLVAGVAGCGCPERQRHL